MRAVEMSYLRGACGVSRMDGMRNKSVYERFGMCRVGEGKKCVVVVEEQEIFMVELVVVVVVVVMHEILIVVLQF